MVYEDRAWAILGSVHGTATHLAEQVVAKARLPLVSPVSTDESVNLAGVPWMFSVAPADHLWAPVLAENLAATADSGAFALIAVTDHDSRLATEAVLDALIALDRAPSYRLDLRPDTTELDSSLARHRRHFLAVSRWSVQALPPRDCACRCSGLQDPVRRQARPSNASSGNEPALILTGPQRTPTTPLASYSTPSEPPGPLVPVSDRSSSSSHPGEESPAVSSGIQRGRICGQ
jgi:hypothetical protein